ncbi:hypothetical protein E3N88_01227 [Mikania micrantha]|uniref:Uncharacterized protein n=1 Tax=Mikania micrantha TaxID=192012 RepID=A0A5N6Q2A3_9ASTR|nr:hypothetical protein E3N88_01227 [Mikania micrantha]
MAPRYLFGDTLLLSWAAEVALDHNLPLDLLWIQPASVLRVYYYYFNGYDKLVGEDCYEPSWSIEIPGLPSLKSRDLPSTCEHFDALEEETLKEIDGKIDMVAVGPLIPSAFLDGNDPTDRSFGGDLFETSSHDYLEWMNTKPQGSIVYISFGTLIEWSKKQKEALAYALIESKKNFLWVLRDKDGETIADDHEEISCIKELQQLGLIVPWCSQLEVLSHPSLGCFVTHCGWNSTLESIVCGVPVVAFPKWSDQATNAKLIEDVWGMGTRVQATVNEDGDVVDGEEIRRCIEMVMGEHERGETMRDNAKKWKDLATEAVKQTGSSYINLKAFVEQIGSTFDLLKDKN